MLLKLCLLKAGFPGQMEKSARGGPWRGREWLPQDPCSGFQEQDPSSFHLGGCAHSLRHHSWICMKAGLQRYHGRAWIQWHPDTKWASETCPEVAGMLKAQDKSTGTYQLHPLGLDYGKGVKRLKYYILTNNSIPHPKSFVFLLLL